MEEAQFKSLMENAGAKIDGKWWQLQNERTMTLHVASEGVGLNLTKISRVRLDGSLLFAESEAGEQSATLLANLFAIAVEAESRAARAAGFR